MAIKAKFPSGTTSITLSALHQWDYGQVLEIESEDVLPAVVEVHFSCAGMTEAEVRACAFADNDIATVEIPDSCLEQTANITAWIYEKEGTQGRTTKSITIPIIARARPNRPAEIPANVVDVYTQLISEVNETIEALKTGTVKVKKAETADNASHATAADSATSATTAQSANEANVARNADVANKATFDENGNRITETYQTEAKKRIIIACNNEEVLSPASFNVKTHLPSGKDLAYAIGVSGKATLTFNSGASNFPYPGVSDFSITFNGFFDEFDSGYRRKVASFSYTTADGSTGSVSAVLECRGNTVTIKDASMTRIVSGGVLDFQATNAMLNNLAIFF